MLRPRAYAGVLGLLLLALTGCGKKGKPLPPLPRGPLQPSGVTARQLGATVLVGFDIPGPRGERPGQQIARAEAVRLTYPAGLDPAQDPEAFRRRGKIVGVAETLPPSGRFYLEDEHLAELDDAGVGWTLRYAVRLRDRKGRPSTLVVAKDLVPVPELPTAAAPTAEPVAEGIRLAWQPPAADEDGRFNVYRSAPGAPWPENPLNAEPLAANEYLDREVETGSRYRYTVRVAAFSGRPYREGASSPGREVLAEDRFPPVAPEGLVAVQEGVAVRLFWNPNLERDIAGYRVYRRAEGGDWRPTGPTVVAESGYLDADVKIGQIWSYRVTAVDRVVPPNESPASDAVEVELLQEPVVPGSEH